MINTRADRKANRQVRCVIYTRKSTSEGLDQKFNSLDAQREAAESYIASQKDAAGVNSPGSPRAGDPRCD